MREKLSVEDRKRLHARMLARAVMLAVTAFFVVYVIPPLYDLIQPFFIAFIIVLLLTPLIDFIHKKVRIKRRFLSLFVVALVFLLVSSLCVWIVYMVVSEAVSLAMNYQQILDAVAAELNRISQKFAGLPDFLPGSMEALTDMIISWLQEAGKWLANYILTHSKTITTQFSGGVISVIMAVLSVYFFAADFPRYKAVMVRFSQGPLYGRVRPVAHAAKFALMGYFRAQLLLASFAFIVMFVALAAYGQPYSLLIALLLGFIDFLPILGTSVLLAPWGIILLIGGDVQKGLFLLGLAGTFFLVRKAVEPRVVGSQTGLSPILALFSMYVGMKLGGVWGMIFGPILALMLISIYKSGVMDKAFRDLKLFCGEVMGIFE